ncbi:hypothetical protein B0H10DRAFT_2219160 [Mycena sp. CBHHK59/15]|nr:hypothetical protein B0H10DRAFT_2219160 [Mycena sp. CBHHK59/15]
MSIVLGNVLKNQMKVALLGRSADQFKESTNILGRENASYSAEYLWQQASSWVAQNSEQPSVERDSTFLLPERRTTRFIDFDAPTEVTRDLQDGSSIFESEAERSAIILPIGFERRLRRTAADNVPQPPSRLRSFFHIGSSAALISAPASDEQKVPHIAAAPQHSNQHLFVRANPGPRARPVQYHGEYQACSREETYPATDDAYETESDGAFVGVATTIGGALAGVLVELDGCPPESPLADDDPFRFVGASPIAVRPASDASPQMNVFTKLPEKVVLNPPHTFRSATPTPGPLSEERTVRKTDAPAIGGLLGRPVFSLPPTEEREKQKRQLENDAYRAELLAMGATPGWRLKYIRESDCDEYSDLGSEDSDSVASDDDAFGWLTMFLAFNMESATPTTTPEPSVALPILLPAMDSGPQSPLPSERVLES